MLTFPKLRSGAVVQYPLEIVRAQSIEVLQFMGGDEQRYRVSAGGLRRWIVRLDLIDEDELSQLAGFFTAADGSFATFSFTDPVDGTVHESCCIASDKATATFSGELRASMALEIQEIRS